jgi:hypothetical protein
MTLGRHKVTTTSDNFGIARRITVSARTWAKKLPTRPVSGASWQSSTSTSHRGRGGSTLRTLGLPAPPPVNVQLTPHTPQNAHCSVGLLGPPPVNVTPVVPPPGSGMPPLIPARPHGRRSPLWRTTSAVCCA